MLSWSDRNEIEVAPHRVGDELCVKITLYDSVGPFFDFVWPINRKKHESEEGYRERVWHDMHKECAEIRRQRIAFINGREVAGRAA